MAKRRLRPEDAFRLRTANDPDLSPDGRRVAFTVAEVDEERDRLRSSIWVVRRRRLLAGARGSPKDRRTRARAGRRTAAGLRTSRSPTDEPDHAHVRLAPLDGGVPARLGELPGPVSQLAWSPDSRRIVVVCRVGVPDRAKASARGAQRAAGPARAGRAPRRGRLAGRPAPPVRRRGGRRVGQAADAWRVRPRRSVVLAGRRHDRVRLRPPPAPGRPPVPRRCVGGAHVGGGRPRRLTNGKGHVAFPVFSPDGKAVAFAGQRQRPLGRRHPRVRRARGRQRRRPSESRRSSIARRSCSPAYRHRCAGSATTSS